MMTKILYLLVVVLAVLSTTTYAQRQLPEVGRQELAQALSTKQGAKAIVQCLVKFQQGCDPRLQRIGAIVPELLRNQGRCAPPTCSPETATNVLFFIKTMQRNYPRLWNELITNAGKR